MLCPPVGRQARHQILVQTERATRRFSSLMCQQCNSYGHGQHNAKLRLSAHHACVGLGGLLERKLLNHRPHAGQLRKPQRVLGILRQEFQMPSPCKLRLPQESAESGSPQSDPLLLPRPSSCRYFPSRRPARTWPSRWVRYRESRALRQASASRPQRRSPRYRCKHVLPVFSRARRFPALALSPQHDSRISARIECRDAPVRRFSCHSDERGSLGSAAAMAESVEREAIPAHISGAASVASSDLRHVRECFLTGATHVFPHTHRRN